MSTSLEIELKERLPSKIVKKTGGSSSGCINSGHCYEIDNGDKIFVKTNTGPHAVLMFGGELESLKAIQATKTIRVPKPLLVIHDYDDRHGSAIAMEFVDIMSLSNSGAKKLGASLANLHDYNNKVVRHNRRAATWIGRQPPSTKALVSGKSEETDDAVDEEENQFSKHSMKLTATNRTATASATTEDSQYPSRFVPHPDTQQVDEFGFHVPTSCGSIPQVNEWTDDWISFFARYRLDKPIQALLADHGDRQLMEEWSHLQLKVDKFFTDLNSKSEDGADSVVPALLHGDLWSGNVAELGDGSDAVIYDASSFYGHSEYDFGIARMFGGISREFERAYFEILPKKKLFEKRNQLYQMFHHLNHWEHFGTGYRASSLRLMQDLNKMVI